MTKAAFDLVVIGAGIAGLAIAELFSRNGQNVALVEKNATVCRESSGGHHEWFHFGSLYSIFPSNQFMRTLVGGIDDLLAYYGEFPGMNIHVGAAGKLEFPQEPGAWIRDDPIDYIVTARNDPDFRLSKFESLAAYARKLFFLLTWEAAIKQFIARHQRFHKFDWRRGQACEWVPRAGWMDYSRDVIFPATDLDARLDGNTHFRVPGFDRPMDSQAIIQDLLRSFLSHGGDLLVAREVERSERATGGGVRVVLKNGETLNARKVVFASGQSLEPFVSKRNLRLEVVASPLLVVYPAVSRQNFVRLSPFSLKTVNHLRHYADGHAYSVIGGGYSAKVDDEAAIAEMCEDFVAMATRVFPAIETAEMVESYVGHKVELVNVRGERNYQYHLRETDENTYVAVPGKFSLAFSLAIDAYKKITGREPSAQLGRISEVDVDAFTAPIRHRRMVADYLKGTAPRN